MQCTGILLVHENNTWQNSTANEGFESVGRGCLDLARGSQNIGAPSVHRAFASGERGIARVLMLSCILQHAHWRRACMSCVFCPTTPPEPPADQPATRKLRHPTVAAHILTPTQPTRKIHANTAIFHINNDEIHINTGFSYKHDIFRYIQIN